MSEYPREFDWWDVYTPVEKGIIIMCYISFAIVILTILATPFIVWLVNN